MNAKGILCIFSGPPLSGKSTFIGALKKQLRHLIIVSTDEIRYSLSKDYLLRPEKEPLVWQEAYAQIRHHLSLGAVVCLDATLINAYFRQEVCKNIPDYPIVYFAFQKPNFAMISARNARRIWKPIPQVTLQKMYDDYEFPTAEEKKQFSQVIEVEYVTFSATIKIGVEVIQKLYESTNTSIRLS